MPKQLRILLILLLIWTVATPLPTLAETAEAAADEPGVDAVEELVPEFAGFAADSVTDFSLMEHPEGLTVHWSAGNDLEYEYWAFQYSHEPLGEDGAISKAELLLAFGRDRSTSLTLPAEKLTAGKYIRIEAGVLNDEGMRLPKAGIVFRITNVGAYMGSAEDVLSIVDLSRDPIEPVRGRIRRIAQGRNDKWFTREYWENQDYNFVYGGDQLSTAMCTRAAYCMALSYLGVNITPVEMSELAGSGQVDHDPSAPYDAITQALEKRDGIKISRISGSIVELFANYAADSNCSPVYVRLRRRNNEPHTFIVVGRDDNYYYVVDSSMRSNGFIHPILVEENRIVKSSAPNAWTKYFNAKITYCHQWKLEAAS